MIPLTNDGDLPRGVFHAAIGVLDFVRPRLLDNGRGSFQFLGSRRQSMEFIFVALGNLGGGPQFGLEPSPDILFILAVLG